jgi:hypothetical protein
VLALVATLAASGCGDLGTGEQTERTDEPQFLSKQDVAEYAPDSPARTVVAWWRALQFESPDVAQRHYAAPVGMTRLKLARQLNYGPGLLNLEARPDVSDVIRFGDRATVFVLLTQIQRHPNGREERQRVARSFNLVLEDGEWKLSDNRYLNRITRVAKALVDAERRKQEREGNRQGPERERGR